MRYQRSHALLPPPQPISFQPCSLIPFHPLTIRAIAKGESQRKASTKRRKTRLPLVNESLRHRGVMTSYCYPRLPVRNLYFDEEPHARPGFLGIEVVPADSNSAEEMGTGNMECDPDCEPHGSVAHPQPAHEHTRWWQREGAQNEQGIRKPYDNRKQPQIITESLHVRAVRVTQSAFNWIQ